MSVQDAHVDAPSDLRVAAALAEAAGRLGEAASLDETLSLITRCACETIPGAEFASISVRYRDGHLSTMAPTDEVISRADQLQYEFREGPCYEAAVEKRMTSSADVASDSRWPRYGPAAAGLGLRSQLALVCFENSHSRGALNLYSGGGAALTGQEDLAELFAKHAATAMGHAYTVEGLKEALATRKVIGQAIGITMQRYELDEERAFEFLIRVSQTGNIKLRDVAAEMVRIGSRAASDG